MSELLEATNNFNPKLIVRDGTFGYVFKAKLSNGVTVALEKLNPDAFLGLCEFRAKMETLAKLRHHNIVNMLGCCVSGRRRVLVYEFIEKGSLDDWIHYLPSLPPGVSKGYQRAPLSWSLRVNIVKGVANGLAFLHCLSTPIVHGEIEAGNVLLDNDFEAHIAHCGLARNIVDCPSNISVQATAGAGTMGYMPPEFQNDDSVSSVKGDVYSFGVLMFEVASGKRRVWPVRENGCNLWMLDWAKKRVSEKKHLKLIDSNVPTESLRDKEVYKFMKIANLCASMKPEKRPLMCEVVEMLDSIAS